MAPRSASTSAVKVQPTSRAVVRLIEAGSMVDCRRCDKQVKFRARQRDQQVICNIYEKGAWKRVEHYHLECYGEVDSPYGVPEEKT
ncbi:MAG: hypothetical protein ACI8TP_003878 [Acidimicrobiales bacterium]|jgi:hypothetical protein